MSNLIRLVMVLSLVVACAPSVKVSDSLKEAWNVVNRDQDIYHRYSVLEDDLVKVNQELESVADQDAIKKLIDQKMLIEAEMTREEEKILAVQETVVKASGKEISYLASL